MVRGNWERRAEIAANRRAESKVRKEEKKIKVKSANGESVYNKLICYFPELKGVQIDAWLRHEPIIKCCSLHMRTEECNNRRCPFSHDCDTLASYPNIQPLPPPSPDETSSSSSSGSVATKRDRSGSLHYTVQEDACFLAPLSEVLPRHRLMIRFVAVDGVLVFDEKIPSIWESYTASLRTTAQRSEGLSIPSNTSIGGGCKVALSTVVEQGDENEDVANSIGDKVDVSIADEHAKQRDHEGVIFTRLRSLSFEDEDRFPLMSMSQKNLQHVFLFLSIESIGRLMCVCKYIKQSLLRDDNVRVRRKEAYSLCSADESKRKKNEKKKKIIAGNARKSAGKKDGLRAKYCV